MIKYIIFTVLVYLAFQYGRVETMGRAVNAGVGEIVQNETGLPEFQFKKINCEK